MKNDKLKILYINEYFSYGTISGTTAVAVNNYYMMQEIGHSCYFYSTDLKPYIEEQELNQLFPKSHVIPKGILDSILYRLNSLFNFSAKRNLEKIIEKVKPDIIHIHLLSELSYSLILAIKKYNIPYVLTVHDAGFVCPILGTKELLCTLCSKNLLNCIKKKCSRNNYFCSAYNVFRFWLSKQLLKMYPPQKIITPSNALKNYIMSTKFAEDFSFEVFPNTLDRDFETIEPNYENKGYFLFVGSLYDAKGVNILLDAIKDLPRDIQFHIIGSGPSEATNRYKKFAEDYNLSNVKFLGKLNRKELIVEYQNCISLLVPSTWFEIFGMINIEAFANGKPVIATSVGGIPEIVDNNVNGIIVEPKNVEQLKNAILMYWKDNNLVREHGKNAVMKAYSTYLSKNAAPILEKIYEEVIKNGN